jgi:hypothetical protein
LHVRCAEVSRASIRHRRDDLPSRKNKQSSPADGGDGASLCGARSAGRFRLMRLVVVVVVVACATVASSEALPPEKASSVTSLRRSQGQQPMPGRVHRVASELVG